MQWSVTLRQVKEWLEPESRRQEYRNRSDCNSQQRIDSFTRTFNLLVLPGAQEGMLPLIVKKCKCPVGAGEGVLLMPINGRNTTVRTTVRWCWESCWCQSKEEMQLSSGGFADVTQKKAVYSQEGLPDLIDMLLLFNSFYLFCSFFFLIKRMGSDSGLSPWGQAWFSELLGAH